MIRQKVKIINETGLHARPATKFVQECMAYECEISINVGGKRVNAKSLLSIMGLGLKHDAEFTICVEGKQEEEALSTLVTLVESGFGE